MIDDRINFDVLDEWCTLLSATLGVTVQERSFTRRGYAVHQISVAYVGRADRAPKVPRELRPFIVARHHYSPRRSRTTAGTPHGEIVIEWRTYL